MYIHTKANKITKLRNPSDRQLLKKKKQQTTKHSQLIYIQFEINKRCTLTKKNRNSFGF